MPVWVGGVSGKFVRWEDLVYSEEPTSFTIRGFKKRGFAVLEKKFGGENSKVRIKKRSKFKGLKIFRLIKVGGLRGRRENRDEYGKGK